jgi:hypothetical protein
LVLKKQKLHDQALDAYQAMSSKRDRLGHKIAHSNGHGSFLDRYKIDVYKLKNAERRHYIKTEAQNYRQMLDQDQSHQSFDAFDPKILAQAQKLKQTLDHQKTGRMAYAIIKGEGVDLDRIKFDAFVLGQDIENKKRRSLLRLSLWASICLNILRRRKRSKSNMMV